MDKIATNKSTIEIIKKYDFIVKKKYGQNFLVDEHVLSKIIRSGDLTENDVVIEIGPGIGGLTQQLARLAHKVIAIEIDKTLIPILTETLKHEKNVEIINEDALKVDFNEIISKYPDKEIKVVANLPYYITTPIIMGLLEKKYKLNQILVMVQKEVAMRMAAKPGTKDYGALTLAVAYYAEPYIVANVPRNCFVPRPNVDSAVIMLTINEAPPVNVKNERLLFSLIKSAFSMRRKTLLNCFFSCEELSFSKEQIKEVLEKCGFSENVRGETLGLKDFSLITETIEDMI